LYQSAYFILFSPVFVRACRGTMVLSRGEEGIPSEV
jgi:hypothetical protein